MKTAIFIHDIFYKHETNTYHPEKPERLKAIQERLENRNLLTQFVKLKERYATKEEISLVHHPSYIDYVENLAKKGGGYLDGDTPISRDSFTSAILAAGSGLEAIDEILKNQIHRALLLVRPPGHHSLKNRGMGFCLFNNIAITARYALNKGFRKILILDWDVHHGNGTQDEFYKEKDVLFISTHQYPFYPGTGSMDEVGEGEGKGYTLNIPMKRGSDDSDIKRVFETLVLPKIIEYEPELILISAGFDAHKLDPLGGLEFSTSVYEWMTIQIVNIASQYCNGRIISFLEGGYSLEALADSVEAHSLVLLD